MQSKNEMTDEEREAMVLIAVVFLKLNCISPCPKGKSSNDTDWIFHSLC